MISLFQRPPKPALEIATLIFLLTLAYPVSAGLSDGVIANYHFNNNFNNSLTGYTTTNGAAYLNGTVKQVGNGSVQGRAVTDYFTVPKNLFVGRPTFSMTGWIYRLGSSTQIFMSNRDGTGRAFELSASDAVHNGFDLSFTSATAGATYNLCYAAAAGFNAVKTWQFFGFAYDGATMYCYFHNMSSNKIVKYTDAAPGGAVSDVGGPLYHFDTPYITNVNQLLDELTWWNRTLSDGEMQSVFSNNSNNIGYPYVAGAPPAFTYAVSVTLANRSKSVKTVFNEGENLRARANFTRSDGVELTVKNCSVLVYNNSIETANHTNRIICTGGSCTASQIVQHYNRTNASILYDAVHFNPCHTSGTTGTLTVRFCGGAAQTVQAAAFASCPTTSFIFLNNSNCKNKGYVSVNISTTATYANRINISSIEHDAFYKTRNLSMRYNSTAKFWQSPFIEYYQHQANSVSVTCVNGTAKATAVKSFTIVNVRPTINIKGFEWDDGSNDSIPGPVEYKDGIMRLQYAVTDDDLDRVRIILRNSTADIKVNITKGALPFLFNSTIIADSGTYNISVWANDTYHNSTYASVKFTINDTAPPSCTGLGDRTVLNRTVWGLKVNCTDEYFFSINITCPSWKFYKENLAAQRYVYLNNTFNITTTQICLYEYCDGHTDSITDLYAGVTKDSISVGSVTLQAQTPLTKITYEKKRDRVTFCATPTDSKASYVQFKIPIGCYAADRSPFLGHLVCPSSRTWVDFQGASGVSISNGLVTAYMSSPGTACFDSIGAFNCVTGNFTVTAQHIPEGLFKTSDDMAIWLMLGLMFFAMLFMAWSFSLPDIYGFISPFLWIMAAFVAISTYYWLAVVLFSVATIDLFARIARVSMDV